MKSIPPDVARRRVIERCVPLRSRSVPIEDTLGLVLGEDVRSPRALPSFDNSAMDGFAVRSLDTAAAREHAPARLRIVATVHAGGYFDSRIREGEAVAIATGAEIPRGADAVIPVEAARVSGRNLTVRSPVVPGAFVRRRGEDVARGKTVLERGRVVHPGVVACLAAMGRARVRVVPRPAVSVIATGDETVLPGRSPGRGRLFDSNSPMMRALLQQAGIRATRLYRVRDDRAAIARALSDALARSDVVITMGGVSVGRRDHVRGVLARLRVKTVFWGVRQQPGKPLYFGYRGRKLVFGLPGNPASAFTCFYLYVWPALRVLSGLSDRPPAAGRQAVDAGDLADPLRWRILKAGTQRGAQSRVEVLAGQGSHIVTALARTSHLALLPPSKRRRRGIHRRTMTLRLPHAEDDSR